MLLSYLQFKIVQIINIDNSKIQLLHLYIIEFRNEILWIINEINFHCFFVIFNLNLLHLI